MPNRLALLCSLLLLGCPARQNSGDGGGQPDGGAPADDAGVLGGADGGHPDAGIRCPSDVEVYDPGSGKCVLGPVLDLGACPAYLGLSCLVTYPRLAVGDSSTESVTVYNTGGAPLTLQPPEVNAVSGNPGAYSVVSNLDTQLVQPGAYTSISIRYSPASESHDVAELVIKSDAVNAAERHVPIAGATTDAGCRADSECLVDELCDLDAGHCSSCPRPTPPACPGGRIVLSSNAMGCPLPVCRCPVNEVYRPGVGCVPATGCQSGCADGGSCEQLCCSFPVCLCEGDGGVCAG